MWEITIPMPTWTGFCAGNMFMFCSIVALIIIGAMKGWWDKKKQ